MDRKIVCSTVGMLLTIITHSYFMSNIVMEKIPLSYFAILFQVFVVLGNILQMYIYYNILSGSIDFMLKLWRNFAEGIEDVKPINVGLYSGAFLILLKTVHYGMSVTYLSTNDIFSVSTVNSITLYEICNILAIVEIIQNVIMISFKAFIMQKLCDMIYEFYGLFNTYVFCRVYNKNFDRKLVCSFAYGTLMLMLYPTIFRGFACKFLGLKSFSALFSIFAGNTNLAKSAMSHMLADFTQGTIGMKLIGENNFNIVIFGKLVGNYENMSKFLEGTSFICSILCDYMWIVTTATHYTIATNILLDSVNNFNGCFVEDCVPTLEREVSVEVELEDVNDQNNVSTTHGAENNKAKKD